jgi:hypothetical protein
MPSPIVAKSPGAELKKEKAIFTVDSLVNEAQQIVDRALL